MAERGSRKIPVTERQFLWVQDDDKGEVILHVGPTMVSPTAADRVVVDDGQGGFREDTSGQPQRMIELSDSQYAVLHNPLGEREDGPNGRFRPGRNESKATRNGTRNMIPGPCSFFLRPGQRCEVRDAHELASNQYLVVKVYGEVDRTAPYYDITAKSAAITTATAEDVTSSVSTRLEAAKPVDLQRGQLIVIRGLDTQFYIPPSGVDVVPDLAIDDKGTLLTAAAAKKILATMPTPVSVAYSGEGSVVAQAAMIPNLPGAPAGVFGGFAPPAQRAVGPMAPPPPAAPPAEMVQMALDEAEAELQDVEDKLERERDIPRKKGPPGGPPAKGEKRQGRFMNVEQAARARHQVQRPAAPAPAAVVDEKAEAPEVSAEEIQSILASDQLRQALEREVRKRRLVRQAVVLGEKEFCVILDADGKRQIKVGPARVFPGPYDSFMTKGSNNRIYYAYELLPQRALWLRFIAQIAREKLLQKLPRGVPLEREKDTFQPGDELILTGVNSFFFPFNEIEILHPTTGQPHVGNDHSDVFIEAIGIDQKSGIYVRDLATGEARLVRGKQSYLVDPRKEVHITRTIPVDEWNLWVAPAEPHKITERPVTTPWAVSINVPHNTAVLATSAGGQRVVEGPCVALLEYEEKLVPLALSTGTPKTDARTLKTCYLRTVGNRVSDVIRVETADYVELDVRVSYRVTFDAAYRDGWFNHENYVGLLTEHLRSLVRGRCRTVPLTGLWSNVPNLIRDIILGEKTETGRRGRLFEENGMHVTEVEVLSVDVLDAKIAGLLETVQRESVSLQINDRKLQEELKSEKLRHDVEKDRVEMKRETREREARLADLVRRIAQEAKLADVRDRETAAREAAELEARRLELAQKAELLREAAALEGSIARLSAETEAGVAAARLKNEEDQAHKRALAVLEMQMIDSQSKATVAERQAVQPALVEALQGLGDKLLLSDVAQNMNLVSLFKGKDVASLFADILGGTKLGRTIRTLLPEKQDGGKGTGP